MESNFFVGMKNNLHNLLKKSLIIITVWMIISTILVNLLFFYFRYYVAKEDIKIFGDIKSASVENRDDFCEVK